MPPLGGIALMLKSFGIDPEKLMLEFTKFKDGVGQILDRIDNGQKANLEAVNRLEAMAKSNEKLLQELTAWKRIQTHQPQLSQPQPPQVLPPPPNQ